MSLVRKHIFLDDSQVDELNSHLLGRNFSLAMRLAAELLLQQLREGRSLFDITSDASDWMAEDIPSPMEPMTRG